MLDLIYRSLIRWGRIRNLVDATTDQDTSLDHYLDICGLRLH